MKSKELKRYNLPNDRIITRSIDAKPYELLIVFVGIGLYITLKNQWFYGGAFTLLGFTILFILPKRVLIEFTETYLVLFNKANSSDCNMIYYEDIVSWIYLTGIREDHLEINLVDGSTQTIEGFSRFLFEMDMNVYLKDKRIRR